MPSRTLLATLRWTWLGVAAVLTAGTMVMAALSTTGSGALLNRLTRSSVSNAWVLGTGRAGVDGGFLPVCGLLNFSGGGGTAHGDFLCNPVPES